MGMGVNYMKMTQILYIRYSMMIYSKIYQLTKKYNLGSISLEQDIDDQYHYVFVIQIPKNYEYKQALKIWDKIISEIELYSISRGYEKFFKNIQIILR